jgi:hypothetical protein
MNMSQAQKNILSFFLLFFFFAHGVMAQKASLTKLVLKETSFDFGKIPQGKPVFHSFEVKNAGPINLQITDVQASCGCTTPEWERDIIIPGSSTAIKIGFNAAAVGYFEKTITLFYGEGETVLITIKGDVWQTPDQPAPSNKSIALLKKVKFNK